MSNETIDLKLNGLGEGLSKSNQQEIDNQEIAEGSYRYDALHNTNVNDLSQESRPTLITLFGISECGKTTFVGSLFAILRRRPDLIKKTFIDSDTLTGFERRVHQRFLSEDGISIIKKTTRKVGSILNVVTGDEQGYNQEMFLISDLSGEVYKDAISDISIVQKQIAVKYAEKLVIFVDAEQLLSSKTYNLYKGNFQSLLARFKENDMMPNEAEVYVALNKIDLVEAGANDASKSETGEIDDTLKKDFLNVFDRRKKAIIEIVKNNTHILDENIFEINSLGIRSSSEDENLIKLFSKLLCRKQLKKLPESYNWIQNLSKN